VSKEQIKYIIATAIWETNHSCLPVKEAFWLDEEWRKKHLRYYPYYGRGFVQLTWEQNYKKFSKLLGVDLVKSPDLALDEKNAVKILVIGMKNGLFSGKKLEDFMEKNGKLDFKKARRIVNGNDRAELIAGMANKVKIS